MVIENFKKIVTEAIKKDYFSLKKRFQELVGIEQKDTYLIELTFELDKFLLEYIDIKQFCKTNNRYRKDPEQKNPPVKAHYHIYPRKGKKEIYAINIDGSAHHQKNKGYVIPKKEADELRKLGVNIGKDNFIEMYNFSDISEKKLLTESLANDCLSVFIEVEKNSA